MALDDKQDNSKTFMETVSSREPPKKDASKRRFPKIRTFSSLKHRNFRFLLAGTFFMSAGNWIQQVTMGWLAYDMTASPFLVGALMGTRSVPFLIAGPLGGVFGDRMDRKKILIATQLASMILAVSLGTLLLNDQAKVWHLFVFAFLSGGAWAFMNPVRMSLVANLVPRDDLMNAVALNSASFNINRALGPAAAGILIGYFGPATNFFLQALMYTGVLAAVMPLNVPAHERQDVSKASLISNLMEGVRYVRHERTILSLLLIVLVPSLFVMPFTHGILPVFSEEILHAGPEGLGYLLSAAGVGGVIGTIIVASLGNFKKKGLLVLGGSLGGGAAMLVFSQMTWMPLAMFLLGVVACSEMVFRATNNTLIQTITPDYYRSRVMSILMMDHGLVPLGSLLAGTLAEFYGSPFAILIGGISVLILVGLMIIKFETPRKA